MRIEEFSLRSESQVEEEVIVLEEEEEEDTDF
jgi:hypothetical protein